MAELQDEKFASLGLSKSVNNAGLVSYSRGLDSASEENPILVLIHGYPQSSYIWRHLLPSLSQKPLFVADIPGYGSSAPPTSGAYDKVTLGFCIMEALKAKARASLPVVLIGHDRGARIAHSLQVSAGSEPVLGFHIIGIALLDIVPTLYQWGVGSTAAAQTGYFHWSFLANVPIASRMILAYGGGNWAKDMISRWSGQNPAGQERLYSDKAADVYTEFFNKESVIVASCKDYEAGAKEDNDFEQTALDKGRAISVPLLLIYSHEFLPKRATKPIPEVWGPPWSERQDLVTAVPIKEGVGHFVAEEAPEETVEALLTWLDEKIKIRVPK